MLAGGAIFKKPGDFFYTLQGGFSLYVHTLEKIRVALYLHERKAFWVQKFRYNNFG
jgi:hypothetical protein